MPGVRITVLKREDYQDLLDEHLPPDAPERGVKRCSVLEDRQMFEVGSSYKKLEALRDGTRRDIRRHAIRMACRVGHPWAHPHPMAAACCAGGMGPAVLKVGRIKSEGADA